MSYDQNRKDDELIYYQKLARAYMHSGDPDKMVLYAKRAFHTKLEPNNGITRANAIQGL